MTAPKTSLKHLTETLCLMLVFAIGLPLTALHFITTDINILAQDIRNDNSILEMLVHEYVQKTITNWALLSLSGITMFLALTQYRLMKDKNAMIIGLLALFFLVGEFFLLSTYPNKINALPIIALYFLPFIALIMNSIFIHSRAVETHHTLRNSQEKLLYMASHDELTGLYNRREFEKLLDRSIAHAHRYNERFSLLIIDIDNFKLINDTYGHLLGDNFLQQFSAQFLSLCRREERLCRLGGDEFALITSKTLSPLSIKQLTKRLLSGLNVPYCLDGQWLSVTVSIGVANYPLDSETAAGLIKKADESMYLAKKAGKNTCHV